MGGIAITCSNRKVSSSLENPYPLFCLGFAGFAGLAFFLLLLLLFLDAVGSPCGVTGGGSRAGAGGRRGVGSSSSEEEKRRVACVPWVAS